MHAMYLCPSTYTLLAVSTTFCCAVLPKITELYRRYLDAYRIHVTISPTARLSAGPIDQVQPWVEHNGKLAGVGDAYGLSVYLGPPLGLPAINIPVGLDTAGLPLGIQLQARPGAQGLPQSCLHPSMPYVSIMSQSLTCPPPPPRCQVLCSLHHPCPSFPRPT